MSIFSDSTFIFANSADLCFLLLPEQEPVLALPLDQPLLLLLLTDPVLPLLLLGLATLVGESELALVTETLQKLLQVAAVALLQLHL